MSQTRFEHSFGELLRAGRVQAGLTVRQLGRLSGIDPTYISRMERGIAPPPQPPKIAAMVRHLPSSKLAKVFAKRFAELMKNAVLQSVNQTLEMLRGVPAVAFKEQAWSAGVKEALESCLALLEKRRR